MNSIDRELSRAARTLKVWDLPTRLFHWSIVVLIGFVWWSAEQRLLDWHRRAGYALLALLIFRVLWGFFGSTTARFASFISGPARTLAYLRSDLFTRAQSARLGHNPLGGWSAMALLTAMLLQTLLGLFAVDIDGIESGPLAYLVSFDSGRLAAHAHHIVFNVLLGVIGLHIAAIAFYRLYKKENLIGAMILGSKVVGNKIGGSKIGGSKANRDTKTTALYFAPLLRAAGLFALSAAAVFVLTQIFGR